MRKLFFMFFVALSFLFLLFTTTKAATMTSTSLCDESSGGTNGLVPCGRMCLDNSNNPIACGTLACGSDNKQPCSVLACRCELDHVFVLILNVYKFLVFFIATPLAALMITIGGVLMIVSGGPGSKNPITGVASPNLYSTAKRMIVWSIIAVVLVFSSWLIITTVLAVIGYTGPPL